MLAVYETFREFKLSGTSGGQLLMLDLCQDPLNIFELRKLTKPYFASNYDTFSDAFNKLLQLGYLVPSGKKYITSPSGLLILSQAKQVLISKLQ